jgi:hypothetical protein
MGEDKTVSEATLILGDNCIAGGSTQPDMEKIAMCDRKRNWIHKFHNIIDHTQ